MNNIWNRLSNYGNSADMPIVSARKIVLTNQLAFIAFGIIFIMNVSFLLIPVIKFDWVPLLSALIILSAPLLNKLGHYKISSFTFTTLMPIAALLFSSISKTQMPPPIPLLVYIFPKFLLLSLLILPLILIDSRNKILLISATAINLACIFLVETVDRWMGVGLDFNSVSFENFERLNLLIVFPISILLLGFAFLNSTNNKYEDEIVNQNQKLESAKTKIESINRNLTDSIQYAEYIQKALLPEHERLNSYFADSFIYFKAKSIVSGDFYFIKESEIKGNKCVVLVAADSTGHGVPGGFMSMLGMSFLNEIIRKDNFANAADILNQLRFNIKLALNQTGKPDEQRDGMDLALILYFPEQKRLEFSGAKNPLYIISENKEITVYKADRMPIGVYLKETPFTNISINLSGGEICYMFTDGIVDQKNEQGHKFLSKKLRELLLENHEKPCKKQKDHFSKEMATWMTDSNKNLVEQIDDMLLLGVKIL